MHRPRPGCATSDWRSDRPNTAEHAPSATIGTLPELADLYASSPSRLRSDSRPVGYEASSYTQWTDAGLVGMPCAPHAGLITQMLDATPLGPRRCAPWPARSISDIRSPKRPVPPTNQWLRARLTIDRKQRALLRSGRVAFAGDVMCTHRATSRSRSSTPGREQAQATPVPLAEDCVVHRFIRH
jgi:hypothetical protein